MSIQFDRKYDLDLWNQREMADTDSYREVKLVHKILIIAQIISTIIIFSKCINPLIEEAINTAHTKISNDGDPSSTLANLAIAIEKDDFASGNIIQLDQTIKLAIVKQAEMLDSDDDIESRNAISKNFTNSVIELNDLVLGSDAAFSNFSVNERYEAIDNVQKNVDETVRLLAKHLADETFEKEANHFGNLYNNDTERLF